MEDTRGILQKANRQGRCGVVDSRNSTGMLLGRQRYRNVRCDKFGQNRLEWRC